MIDMNQWLINQIGTNVRGGLTPEQAYKDLCQVFPTEQVKRALNQFEEQTNRIRTLKEPRALEKPDLANWYPGPSPDDRYWPPLKKLLIERGWKYEAIDSLDQASSKVVSLLQPSGLGRISTRGLVVGYVQSGKTANFSAVIAKAADIGYKLFIVLSGLTNLLRYQTQHRLTGELSDLNPDYWVALTSLAADFIPGPLGNVNAFLTDRNAHKVLGVVKKNATVLRRLKKWLAGAHPDVISNCPVLIIDDEADQASVNASGNEDKRTAINQHLMDILSALPKAAYVGYTATPFANIFIDPGVPEDLYPRDFILDLPRPSGYFGAEQLFGREKLYLEDTDGDFDGFDMIRRIDDDEVPDLSPRQRDRQTFEPVVTPSLQIALRYFWLAAAARIARGDREKHSTMLIHTSLHTIVHERFQDPVERYRDKILVLLESGDQTLLEELGELWDKEQERVLSEEVGERFTSFDDLRPYLLEVLSRSTIVIENSRSLERLEYGTSAKIQIVIGGNTLARGLTLEGLIVSFFVRASTAYDTLLQMGRWFGYRNGYADLPRIWMTDELKEYFYDLATVEQEIRNDIKKYELEGMTPLEFGVRVRIHPALEITSRLKMQATVDCDISYSGEFSQTILFKHKNKSWLQQNINAATTLLREMISIGIQPVERSYRTIFRNVPVEYIFSFLRNYRFHETNVSLSATLLTDYIVAQNRLNLLLKWNVVVVSRSPNNTSINLAEYPFTLLNRSKLVKGPESENTANLGVIADGATDRLADFDYSRADLKEKNSIEMAKIRDEQLPDVGLLLIYPISKDSKPEKGERAVKQGMRKNLEAVEDIIGVGLVFPEAKDKTPQRYKTVDLSRIEREEEPEIPEEEEGI